MKKMSRVLGIDINQVAKMLEAQERAANGEIEQETPPKEAVSGDAVGEAAGSAKEDDPFSKFMREQNGSGAGGGSEAKGNGAATPSAAAVVAVGSAPEPEKETPPCVVLFCGATDWDMMGRGATEGDIAGPQRLLSFPKRIKVVASGPTACHSVCIDVDGGVYTWGRNEKGALGHGDLNTRPTPTAVSSLAGTRIRQASCGKLHTALVAENGTLYTMGGGKMGQLGTGRPVESCSEPKAVHIPNGATCLKASCGAEYTAMIDNKGRLLTFGSPQDGQLGGGTTGEFIEKAGKISYDLVLSPTVISLFIAKDARTKVVDELRDIELADIAVGRNHSVAVERPPKARVFTWGFGGYGRLGHACQELELRPRMVDGLARLPHITVVKVAAGSGSSMAVTSNGHLFYWGKLPNAPRGEATMYPKIVDDLSNWQVRSVTGSNGAIMVAAETSTISWGTSVGGELGYGEASATRTSTKPKLVDPLEGLTVMQVAMGYGHSLLLARDDKDSAATLKGLGECVPFEAGDGDAGGKEDEEDAEEEEEEEEAPARKKKKTSKTTTGRPRGKAGAKGKGKAKR